MFQYQQQILYSHTEGVIVRAIASTKIVIVRAIASTKIDMSHILIPNCFATWRSSWKELTVDCSGLEELV